MLLVDRLVDPVDLDSAVFFLLLGFVASVAWGYLVFGGGGGAGAGSCLPVTMVSWSFISGFTDMSLHWYCTMWQVAKGSVQPLLRVHLSY